MKVICDYCGIEFDKRSSEVRNSKHNFCCLDHSSLFRKRENEKKRVPNVECAHCGNKLYRTPSKLKKSKTGLFFVMTSVDEQNKE